MGSAFHGFHRDKYTLLPKTWDRILFTKIMMMRLWSHFDSLISVQSVTLMFDRAHKNARTTILEMFVTHKSATNYMDQAKNSN